MQRSWSNIWTECDKSMLTTNVFPSNSMRVSVNSWATAHRSIFQAKRIIGLLVLWKWIHINNNVWFVDRNGSVVLSSNWYYGVCADTHTHTNENKEEDREWASVKPFMLPYSSDIGCKCETRNEQTNIRCSRCSIRMWQYEMTKNSLWHHPSSSFCVCIVKSRLDIV